MTALIDDRTLAMLELSQDLLFHKIQPSRLGYYVDGSIAAGQTVAEQFAGRDMLELYKKNRIIVEYKPNPSPAFGVTLRGLATMSAKECKVEIYTESIQALAEHSAYGGIAGFDADLALKVHLAHEFYHFWEYKNGGSVAQSLDSVETFRFLGFSRKAKINRCGEIAAHTFAKRMTGVCFLPNLFDYVYLIGAGKLTLEGFEKKLMEMRALLAG
jgi:hypothetical protein